MFRSGFDKETIDAIGRKLAERDLLSVDEIDSVIEDPGLFHKVNRRIEALQRGREAEQAPKRRGWVPAAAASFGSLAVLAVLATAVFERNDSVTTVPAVTKVQVPDAAPEIARPVVPPVPIVNEPSAGRALNSEYAGPRIEKAAFRSQAPRISNVRPRPAPPEPQAQFYPVAYTGDPAETAGGGRIIRVNLNRSALFAMGVNVPLENDHTTVKADLLVGVDGVTRAVRLVE